MGAEDALGLELDAIQEFDRRARLYGISVPDGPDALRRKAVGVALKEEGTGRLQEVTEWAGSIAGAARGEPTSYEPEQVAGDLAFFKEQGLVAVGEGIYPVYAWREARELPGKKVWEKSGPLRAPPEPPEKLDPNWRPAEAGGDSVARYTLPPVTEVLRFDGHTRERGAWRRPAEPWEAALAEYAGHGGRRERKQQLAEIAGLVDRLGRQSLGEIAHTVGQIADQLMNEKDVKIDVAYANASPILRRYGIDLERVRATCPEGKGAKTVALQRAAVLASLAQMDGEVRLADVLEDAKHLLRMAGYRRPKRVLQAVVPWVEEDAAAVVKEYPELAVTADPVRSAFELVSEEYGRYRIRCKRLWLSRYAPPEPAPAAEQPEPQPSAALIEGNGRAELAVRVPRPRAKRAPAPAPQPIAESEPAPEPVPAPQPIAEPPALASEPAAGPAAPPAERQWSAAGRRAREEVDGVLGAYGLALPEWGEQTYLRRGALLLAAYTKRPRPPAEVRAEAEGIASSFLDNHGFAYSLAAFAADVTALVKAGYLARHGQRLGRPEWVSASPSGRRRAS